MDTKYKEVINKVSNENLPTSKAGRFMSAFLLPLLVLVLLTIILQLAQLYYTLKFDPENTLSFQSVLIPSISALVLITVPLASLGLYFGNRTNLGAPLLTDLLMGRRGSVHKLISDATLAIPLGLGTGILLLPILLSTWPSEIPPLGRWGVVGGLWVSAGAAVGEEVWIRLGVMTMLMRFAMRLLGHSELKPSVAWSIILLSSIIFGLIHLPGLIEYGAFSLLTVFASMLGNGFVGILYGWMYWRRSLIAAILAHFSVDVVLHVFTAI